MQHFGDLLKHQRERQGLSPVALSELTGFTLEMIQLFEHNDILPSKIQMEQLSHCEPLAIQYEQLRQWKCDELKNHWDMLKSSTNADPKWICPQRRWDCPCCLWPYTLQCEFKKQLSAPSKEK